MAAEIRPGPDHSTGVLSALRLDAGRRLHTVAYRTRHARRRDCRPPCAGGHGHHRQPQPGRLDPPGRLDHQLGRACSRSEPQPAAQPGATAVGFTEGRGPRRSAPARAQRRAEASTFGTPRGVAATSAEHLSEPIRRSFRLEIGQPQPLAKSISGVWRPLARTFRLSGCRALLGIHIGQQGGQTCPERRCSRSELPRPRPR